MLEPVFRSGSGSLLFLPSGKGQISFGLSSPQLPCAVVPIAGIADRIVRIQRKGSVFGTIIAIPTC